MDASLIKLKDYGEVTLAQNKLFDPIKLGTTAVIDHGITTRRVGQRKISRCRRTHRAVLCSRQRPLRPRAGCPSALDAASPRYPHIHYRNPGLCRVPDALPSAFCRALGKDDFAESRTRRIPALGNELVYRVQDTRHRRTLGTRQRWRSAKGRQRPS